MSKRRFVNGIECRQLLTEMAQKRTFLTVTNREDNIWRVYKSHFLSVRGNQLVLSQPIPDSSECHLEPVAGQEVAISFKKGYNKFLFLTRVVKADQYEMEPGHKVPVINIYAPDHIEKIQRRAYNRADVPKDLDVDVTFWSNTGAGLAEQYHSTLANLSAGGVAVTMSADRMPELHDGEQVTMQFKPLPDQKPIKVEARFRHKTDADDAEKPTLGFQFIGLEVSEEGRRTLRQLSRAVGVYHRNQPISEHQEISRHD
ncbi:MAG: PilZ domain-containing protein [Sedimentisphaerales bacterium]|nr:PilZ domain-containing protein [Sedimentisphaerales bacterium]